MENYNKLKSNLGRYLAKYYLNEFVKGLLVSLLIGLITWLSIALLEYFGEFNKTPRTIFFFGFVAIAGTLFISQILLPIAKYFGILKGKNDETAAKEIGTSIHGVDDKLSNILSLKNKAALSSNDLLNASIDQKASQLNHYDFRSAINAKKNLVWLRYLAIPVAIVLLILLWNPSILRDSSKRVVSFNQDFTPVAPFSFKIKNKTLSVAEGEDFELLVETIGSKIPENTFIDNDGKKLRLKKLSNGQFVFKFLNVMDDVRFHLEGGGFSSAEYTIKMLPTPKVLRNSAAIDYPAYTNLKDQILTNQTQLQIPEGTTISWVFDLKNVSEASVNNESVTDLKDGQLNFSQTFLDGASLNFAYSNEQNLLDSTKLNISVVKDAFPGINVNELLDTNNAGIRYFAGKVSDDYGFSKMNFVAEIRSENKLKKVISIPLSLQKNATEQGINFLWNTDTIGLEPNETIEYYFSVWDNDGINGAKQSTSQKWKIDVPSLNEMNKESSKESEKTKDLLDKEQSELDKMEKDMKALRKDLLEKKKPDWEEKEKFQELLEQQKEMMKKLEDRAQEQQKQNSKDNKFNEYSEELLEKQKRIEEMFDKLFDEEFKEKYEEWSKMMEEFGKKEMLEKLDEMELDNEKLEKELDRTLELFKELELEQKVENLKNKAEKLSEKQEDLKEKTQDKKGDSDELKEEQDKLTDEMKELKDDLKKLEELNKDLEQPKSLPDLEKDADKAEDEMEKSSENLDKNNKSKSEENQQNAKEELDKMGEKLNQFQQQQSQDQQSENLEDMRQLLENLLDLSINQEQVMDDLKKTQLSDPKYVDISKRQKDLIDDTKVVEDSLLALSKRVPEISKEINDEISTIKQSMNKALQNMTDQMPNQEQKYKAMAAEKQQYAMTSLNNLANKFDEIMQQMQNQMMQNKEGNGSCNKPGQKPGSKPSAMDMKKMQDNLNKKLEEMKKAMEKGQKPGEKPGSKPGQKPGMGQSGMSQSLAKMAAEQAAIREQLRQMSESLEKEGSKPGSGLKELEKMMEQTEEDILFQNITQETLKRQQDIITKLLESDKAEREREMDKERKSKTPSTQFNVPQDIWEEYLNQKNKELELYQTLPPNLKPFYRNRVNRYFSDFIIQ
ncbi:MAG: hypothetical protein NWR30_05805 [Salibacteraceae bacterium]|nr:hypothetical protein [Salibacteraceae bacterium]